MQNYQLNCCQMFLLSAYKQCKESKGYPYSLPSVGPGADPDVQAVSTQVT